MKKLRILQDRYPVSPREDDNAAVLYCEHSRYNLGDKQFNSSSEADKHIAEITQEGGFVETLYLYVHSGLSISTIPFSNFWDSGQIGFVYITKETIDKECPDPENARDWCKQIIESEVDEYDMFLHGDVYGYELVETTVCKCCGHTSEGIVDSCWGYYSYDYLLSELKDMYPGIDIEQVSYDA